MAKLPDAMQSTLDSLVEDLKSQEAITGVALFGSWSRGDAVESSDVDLLIVDKRDFEYEYTERIELDNLLIDLNYVPE
ncbi:MAG: nucleotidyltransferase domain-containing protein, partial [Candidatus Bathyarchaeia archaeon]